MNPSLSSADLTQEQQQNIKISFEALRGLHAANTGSYSSTSNVIPPSLEKQISKNSNHGSDKPKDIAHEEKKEIDFSSTKCTKPIRYPKDFQEKLDILENILACFYSANSPIDYKEVHDLLDSFESVLDSFCKKHVNTRDPLRLKVEAINYALKCVEKTPNKNDDLETELNKLSNPEETDPEEHNADSLRIICLMKADLMIKKNYIKQAKELLQFCWDVPQKYFQKKDEDYLDFYAAYKARIFRAEGNLDGAEKCLREALELRIWRGNSRLISLSYNDLALFYIEKASKGDDSKVNLSKAEDYLKKAKDYDRNFMNKFKVEEGELTSKDKDAKILFGQVDYRRADLDGTKKALDEVRTKNNL